MLNPPPPVAAGLQQQPQFESQIQQNQITIQNMDAPPQQPDAQSNQHNLALFGQGQSQQSLSVPQPMSMQQQLTFQNSLGMTPDQAAQYFKLQSKQSMGLNLNQQDTVGKIEPHLSHFGLQNGLTRQVGTGGMLPPQQQANMNQAMDLLIQKSGRPHNKMTQQAVTPSSHDNMPINTDNTQNNQFPGYQQNQNNQPSLIDPNQNQTGSLSQQQAAPPQMQNQIPPSLMAGQMNQQMAQQMRQPMGVIGSNHPPPPPDHMQNHIQQQQQEYHHGQMQQNMVQQQPGQYLSLDARPSIDNQFLQPGHPTPSQLAPELQMLKMQSSENMLAHKQTPQFQHQLSGMANQIPHQIHPNVDIIQQEIQQQIQQVQMYKHTLFQQLHQFNQGSGPAPQQIGDQPGETQQQLQHNLQRPPQSQEAHNTQHIPYIGLTTLTTQPKGQQINVNGGQNILTSKEQLQQQPVDQHLSLGVPKHNPMSIINRRQSMKGNRTSERSQITGISNLSQFDDQMLPSNSIISAKNTQFKVSPMMPQTRPAFVGVIDLNQIGDDTTDNQTQYEHNTNYQLNMSGYQSTNMQLHKLNSLPIPQPQFQQQQHRGSVGNAEQYNRVVSLQKISQEAQVKKRMSLNQKSGNIPIPFQNIITGDNESLMRDSSKTEQEGPSKLDGSKLEDKGSGQEKPLASKPSGEQQKSSNNQEQSQHKKSKSEPQEEKNENSSDERDEESESSSQESSEESSNKDKNIADEIIEEDEEYDGISYLPTPQFLNDKLLLGVGQSSRGSRKDVGSGSILNNTKKEGSSYSQASKSSKLGIPKKERRKSKGKKKKGESEIDGELMSKASKSKKGQGKTYIDEVSGGQINKQWIDDLDNFLLDEEGDQFNPNDELQNSGNSRSHLNLKLAKRQSERKRPSSNMKERQPLTPSSQKKQSVERSRSNPHTPNTNKTKSNNRDATPKKIADPVDIPLDKKTKRRKSSALRKKRQDSTNKIISEGSPQMNESISSHKFDEYNNSAQNKVEDENKSKEEVLIVEIQEQNDEGQKNKGALDDIDNLLDCNEEEEEQDKVENLKQKSFSNSSSSSGFNLVRSQTPSIQIVKVKPSEDHALKRRSSVGQIYGAIKPIVRKKSNVSKNSKRSAAKKKEAQKKLEEKKKQEEEQKKIEEKKKEDALKKIAEKKKDSEAIEKPKKPQLTVETKMQKLPQPQKEYQEKSSPNLVSPNRLKEAAELQKKKVSGKKLDQYSQIDEKEDKKVSSRQNLEEKRQKVENEIKQIKEYGGIQGRQDNNNNLSQQKEKTQQNIEQILDTESKIMKTIEKPKTDMNLIDISPPTGTVIETPSRSQMKTTNIMDTPYTNLKQTQSNFLSSPSRDDHLTPTPKVNKADQNKDTVISLQNTNSAKPADLELIKEQSNENEGTADAEKKSQISQIGPKINEQYSNRLLTPVKEPDQFLEAPNSHKNYLKKQFSTRTDETHPLRQESKQTLLSGLTSQQQKFGSESSYANNLQNKLTHSKLNSKYLANKFQMTGALSKNTLGETYEISEDIHISNSGINSHQLSKKAKQVSGNNDKLDKSPSQTLSNTIKQGDSKNEQKKKEGKGDKKQEFEGNQPIKELRESKSSNEKDSKKTKKSSPNYLDYKDEKNVKNKSIDKNSLLKQSILQNTLSIQQQLSQFEQSSSQNRNSKQSHEDDKISSISSTGIVQQTERHDVKKNLENDNQQFQEQQNIIKSKSYQKDEVLNQIINLQQNQEKTHPSNNEAMKKKQTTISGYYKYSEGNFRDQSQHGQEQVKKEDLQYYLPNKANATYKQKDTQFRSMYSSVSTRSLQPSLQSQMSKQLTKQHSKLPLGPHNKHKKAPLYNRMGTIQQANQDDNQMQESNNKRDEKNIAIMKQVNRKFNIIFDSRFYGHKQYLQKKKGAIQQNNLHLRQRGYFEEANDFDDIVDYTERVTFNVLKSVQEGLFSKYQVQKFNIPNLMAIEDDFLFGSEILPELWDKTISSQEEQEDFNEESILKTSETPTGNQLSGNRTRLSNRPSNRHLSNRQRQIEQQLQLHQQQQQLQQQSLIVNTSPQFINNSRDSFTNDHHVSVIPTPERGIGVLAAADKRLSCIDPAFQTFSPIGISYPRSFITQQRQTEVRKRKKKVQSQQHSPDLRLVEIDLKQHQEMEKEKALKTKLMYQENKQRMQRIEEKKKRMDMIENQEKEAFALNHQRIQELLQQEKVKRKQEAKERLKKMENDRKEKFEYWKKLKQDEKFTIESKPLYQKMEEFQQKKNEKEQVKILKKIKNRKLLFKPMIQGELDEFASKVDLIVNHLNQKKKEERDQKREQDLAIQDDMNVIKTDIYKKMAEDNYLRRHRSVQEFENKKDLYNKKQQYAKFIKFAHQPPIDQQKKIELKDRITNLKHPVKQSVKIPPGTIIKLKTRPTTMRQVQHQSTGNLIQIRQQNEEEQKDEKDQNGGNEAGTNQIINIMNRRQSTQNISIQNNSQIQQASKINALQLPPINRQTNKTTIEHPKKWNQSIRKQTLDYRTRNERDQTLKTLNEVKKQNFMKSNTHNAFTKLRYSSQEPKINGLAHIERYEENKFIRERNSQSQGKAKDYLQEMRQKREKQRKKSISLLSSGNNTIKTGYTRTSQYNQDVFATMRKHELSALEKLHMLAEHTKDLDNKKSDQQIIVDFQRE